MPNALNLIILVYLAKSRSYEAPQTCPIEAHFLKTYPGLSIEVRRTLDFHFSPPKLLYIRADT
jgi:hypothetical protein